MTLPDRTVEALNIRNPDHAGFMYDLGLACKEDFLDDYRTDILLIMQHYQNAVESEATKAFICRENGENAGIIWVDIDEKRIGYLHAGLMPAFRKGFTALHFMRLFKEFCFEELNIRKLEAYIPIRNKAAETLVRRLGFRKEGIRTEATTINGIPETHVVLTLTKTRNEDLKHGFWKRRR